MQIQHPSVPHSERVESVPLHHTRPQSATLPPHRKLSVLTDISNTMPNAAAARTIIQSTLSNKSATHPAMQFTNTVSSIQSLNDDIDAIITNIQHINNTAHVVRMTPITAFDLDNIVLPTISYSLADTSFSKPVSVESHDIPLPSTQSISTDEATIIHTGQTSNTTSTMVLSTARPFLPTISSTVKRPSTCAASINTNTTQTAPTATLSTDTTITKSRSNNDTNEDIDSISTNTGIIPVVQPLNLSGIHSSNNSTATTTHTVPVTTDHLQVDTTSNMTLPDTINTHHHDAYTDDCHTLPGSVAMLTVRDNNDTNTQQLHYITSSRLISTDNTPYSVPSTAASTRPVTANDLPAIAKRQQMESAAHTEQLEQQHIDMLKSIQQQQQWIQSKLNAPIVARDVAENMFASPRSGLVQDILQKHQSVLPTQSINVTPANTITPTTMYPNLVPSVSHVTDQHTNALLMSQQMMLQQQAASQAHNQQILTALLTLLQDKQRSDTINMTQPVSSTPYNNIPQQFGQTIVSPVFTPPVLLSPTATATAPSHAHTFAPASPVNGTQAPSVAQQPYISDEQRIDLFTKCRSNRHALVEELFANGIPVDCSDAYGNQCLHIAAQNNSKRMIKACLRWGADINACNIQGNTPLHYCMAYHYDVLSNYLLSKGASDQVVNFFGYTPQQGILLPPSREEAIQKLHENMPTMSFSAEQLELILGNANTAQT